MGPINQRRNAVHKRLYQLAYFVSISVALVWLAGMVISAVRI